MTRPEMRRSVEELAQALYEASDPSGIPWVRRGRVVRESWLHTAQEQIAQSEDRLEKAEAGPKAEVGPDAEVGP